jgi:hypothetical protein
LEVELVMVSAPLLPKSEPGPVSYVQFAEEGALPAGPSKLSLNWVLHPEGGGGTVTALAAVGKAAKTAIRPTETSAALRRPRLTSERMMPGMSALSLVDVIYSSRVHRPPPPEHWWRPGCPMAAQIQARR